MSACEGTHLCEQASLLWEILPLIGFAVIFICLGVIGTLLWFKGQP